MTNVQQTPNQKTQDDRYSNQSGKQNPQGQGQDKNSDLHKDSQDANRKGGMHNDPQNKDQYRDPQREEEDRPRANADKR